MVTVKGYLVNAVQQHSGAITVTTCRVFLAENPKIHHVQRRKVDVNGDKKSRRAVERNPSKTTTIKRR